MTPERLIDYTRLAGFDLEFDPPVVVGTGPVYQYPVDLGEAATAALALCVDAACQMWSAQGGGPVLAEIDLRAAGASLAGFALTQLVGSPTSESQWIEIDDGVWRPWGADAVLRGENAGNPVVGMYRCRDGRWIHLHGGAAHLGRRIVDLLGVESNSAAVAEAVARWNAFELETALAEAETCAAVARTTQEWSDHPQGRAIAGLSTVDLAPSNDSARARQGLGDRPLSGVRVLEFGDGLAGPTCGRVLASLGADVIRVAAPDRPGVEPFRLDTGWGKRTLLADLRSDASRRAVGGLAAQSDVIVDSYRDGVLDRWGLGAADLLKSNPAVILTSINCYGPVGPWSVRRGWEQLGQIATGLALATSLDGRPRLAPAAVCDYLTGYFAAYGTIRALTTGPTHAAIQRVRASLCQTANWLEGLPTTSHGDAEHTNDIDLDTVDDLLVDTECPGGTIRHLRSPMSTDVWPDEVAVLPAETRQADWLPRAAS